MGLPRAVRSSLPTSSSRGRWFGSRASQRTASSLAKASSKWQLSRMNRAPRSAKRLRSLTKPFLSIGPVSV